MKRAALLLAILAIVGLGAGRPALAGEAEVLPVAKVTIYPGDIILDTMIAEGRFVAGTAASLPIVGSRVELVGMVARRTLLPGRLITRNAVGRPELIRKGTIVSAVYRSGTLTITASVLALQAGSLDDAIQARNIDSGKVIVGLVQADGSLRIAVQ